MATNISLKEQLRSRGAAKERASIEDIVAKGVDKAEVSEVIVDKSLGESAEVTSRKKSKIKSGSKAYIQLALSTDKYRSLNEIEICEGELKHWKLITEELTIEIQVKRN